MSAGPLRKLKVTWASVSRSCGRSIAAKVAVRSARGLPNVPVTAPPPSAAPAISNGPTSSGPLACQATFNASVPSPPTRPVALAAPAAPLRSALVTSNARPFQIAWPFSAGVAPSSRSRSA